MSNGFNPLAGKLKRLSTLSTDDEVRLDEILADTTQLAAGETADLGEVANDDAISPFLPVVCEGVVARVRMFDGKRQQITGILLPGDMGDVHCTLLDRDKYAIRALAPSRLAMARSDTICEMFAEGGNLAAALWRSTQIDAANAREWIASLGRRDALGRLAHLLCEMQARLQNAGLADSNRFEMPITQRLLADTLGLSVVHVNRTIRRLQQNGLIRIKHNTVELIAPEQLHDIADFNAKYLYWSENV